MKFKLKDIPKDLLKSVKEDCVWDVVQRGILEIENIPTIGDVEGGTYLPDFKKLMEYRLKDLNGLLIMFNISDQDKEKLIGYVVYIDNGDYIVIPEDQYDAIPESIGDKYGIHHLDVENDFNILN